MVRVERRAWPAAPQGDTFGDLLGGMGMGATSVANQAPAGGVAATADDASGILSQPGLFCPK